MVESQPSKLLVAGSIPVSRSRFGKNFADVAQLVEHSLGKGEVTGSIPVISSRIEVEQRWHIRRQALQLKTSRYSAS